MGGLRKHMPVTHWVSLIGSLALIGTPLLSGFYSKDLIIEAAHAARVPGATFAFYAVLAGVFITAFYSFRMYFLVFWGKERYDQVPHGDDHHHDDHGHHGGKPHESPWVVTLPLVLLAIPSLGIGFYTVAPMLFHDYFAGVIKVSAGHGAMEVLKQEFHGAGAMALHALTTVPFWLAFSGVALAYYCYMINPAFPAGIKRRFSAIHTLLEEKYYFDRFNEVFFAGGARLIGTGLWKGGDQGVIDGIIINGSARFVGWVAQITRLFQTGHLYTYAIAMIVAVLFSLTALTWTGMPGLGK